MESSTKNALHTTKQIIMRKYLLILILSLIHFSTIGQVIEQLSPQERKQLTKVTEPITLYKGFLRLGLSNNFSVLDKMFDESGKKVFYNGNISGQVMATIFSVQYGITDRIELETVLPYAIGKVSSTWSYEIPSTGEMESQTSRTNLTGLGDAIAILRYQLIQDKENSPGLTFGVGASLPTGKKDAYDFENSTDFTAPGGKGEIGIYSDVRLRKIMYPFSFEVGAAFTKFMGTERILEQNGEPVKVVSGNEIVVRPQMSFHLNDWVVFTHYVDYYSAGKDDFEGEDKLGSLNNQYNQWTLRYYPGINFQVKNLRLEQVVLVPLAGKVVTADPSFYFIIQYMF
jgi:hypothetical protein